MTEPQTRLNAFRHTVAATIAAGLPALESCEAQFARFDLDDLKRRSIRTPAVRVAILSVRFERSASGFDARLKCAAFIVHDGKGRDDKAWAMAEAIALQLGPRQLWGIHKMQAPESVEISPLTSATIERQGVTLIAVQWSQKLLGLDAADLFAEEQWLIEELYVNDEQVEPEASSDG